jgi:Poly(R)-hydroxyalkanoic acid synthase subunit (PHA_synth_III_E)
VSAREPFPGTFPFSADFLKVWMDQAGAFQDLFTKLVDKSASVTMPLSEPWKAFIDGLGMGIADSSVHAMPPLGLSREYQEIGGRLLDLGKQFQQRCGELTQQGASVMQDALQIMKKRIEAKESLLTSPADLYDEWIECAEACYAQAARGDTFARLFAELCNIASAIKIERGKLVERIARQLDLPSREEVDTLNRQVRLLAAAAAAATAAATAAPAPARAAQRAKAPPKKPARRARTSNKRARS